MNRGYLISIITPSRNTSDELFRAAFDSVMAQTLDESFIEWVIVVHNSTQEHLDFVRSLCEGHPGFRVYKLNNDRHTASSPRNYALSKAAGKYVTFLDADDRLTPECLETIVYGMDKTGAQVGKFRSEKTEEDDGIVGFLDNRVRFPQTAPLISLHKGDPDIRKIMTMANMMMSCQVIERSHLEKHSIRFREHVRIYEDVVFNIECLRDAETIAVFPQLIGYIYYMHHGSTMQDLKAPAPEEILSTCRDIAFQLRLGVDSGLSSEDRELFCSLFDADPARARELRDIFACGFDEPVIRRIWPGMKRIVACRSVEFELYTYHLARYAGDIPVTDSGHVDSEAVLGTSCGDGCYRLAYGECYFEFIPEGRDEKDVLAAEELREGCYYEVLVTNRAGLYRYRLGDVIRVERMENGTPVYRFAGKVSNMLRPLSVSILQPLTHLAYRDKRMYQQKIAPDQIKPVHELNASPVAARFFDVFIVKDRD